MSDGTDLATQIIRLISAEIDRRVRVAKLEASMLHTRPTTPAEDDGETLQSLNRRLKALESGDFTIMMIEKSETILKACAEGMLARLDRLEQTGNEHAETLAAIEGDQRLANGHGGSKMHRDAGYAAGVEAERERLNGQAERSHEAGLTAGIEAGRMAERERCAKIADACGSGGTTRLAELIASRIRSGE